MKQLLLILLFLAVSGLNAQFYKDLEFKEMKNFTFDKADDKVVIGFDYVIYNPNWYRIVVKPSQLDLMIADQDCGKVEVDQKIKIKNKTEDVYHFTLVGESGKFVKSAFSSLWSMITGKGVSFNIKGPLKAGAFLLRPKWHIDYTYQMSFEEFLSFF